jgi:CBS domain containing-hemolysin-like protein
MVWLAVIAALLGACFATLNLSLRLVSRVRLEQYLAARGRSGQADPVFADFEAHSVSLAIGRAVFTVLLILFTVAVALVSERAEPLVSAEELLSAPRVVWALIILFGWMLIFGTVVPASIGRHAAVPIVALALPLIRVTRFLCYPIIAPMRSVDAVIKRLAGEHAIETDDIDERIMSVVSEGERVGQVDEAEKEMIEGIVELRDTTVEEIMTPRIDIEGIELTDDIEEIKRFIGEAGHSRIPVFQDDLDHIVGILYVKDLIPYVGAEVDGFRLKSVLRDPVYIPETKLIHDLLTEAQQTNIHIAIVVDEYGGTAGLVTIEDILEEIVGEIRDEYEPEEEQEPTITRLDETSADIDARVYVSDLNDEMLDDLGCPLSEDEDYDTVGGFVFAQLGHVPEAGESFTVGRLQIIISEAEKTRVGSVRLHVLPREAVEETAAVEPKAAANGRTRNGNGNGNGNGRSDEGQADDAARDGGA